MFLDIAIGILVSVWVGGKYFIALPLYVVFFSVALSFFMDIDALIEEIYFRLRKRKLIKHDHRDIFHFPIPYILIGSTAFVLLNNFMWLEIFILVSLLHFLHDSIGLGWGVYWLYPLTKKRYSFLYQYDIFKHKLKPYKIIYSWTDEELTKMETAYGDPHWIKNIYFKFHPYPIVEFIVFLFALYFYFAR